ncbi:MAG: four helix bundle protein [Terriglobales bacterium]
MSASYKDLVAWQQGMELVELIHEFSTKWPRSEVYGLVSQVRRAAVSVVSNIAEGQGRNSRGEFLQFLGNARGSLLETETQILVAQRLKYLNGEESRRAVDKIDRVSRLLYGLMQSLNGSAGPKTRNQKPETKN